MQPDSKILVAGRANQVTNGGYDFAIARYHRDGSPDNSFGSGGKVTTDFNGYNDGASVIALQDDGKILLAGYTDYNSGAGIDFAVARYTANGALDQAFADLGWSLVDFGGGAIDVGSLKYLVRVDGEFPDPAVIGDIVVKAVDGRPVYVRDIARVEFGFAERESFSRMGGDPVVTLSIVARSGENIIETAEAVAHEIELLRPEWPPSTEVSITGDQSRQIEMMVESLSHHMISGMILIVGVLFFFLGLRTSMLVAVSLPTSSSGSTRDARAMSGAYDHR